ncbi:sigma 54-interacting transcriptional regulator [Clostridium sp. MB40-C1]|uniref:sigma 54-interacting transcriptional regulator n=1 Tax=Clostridium sp. MB40-C1 TaxID=3070996 RepID=UPI0027E1C90D|nr:sigma 54-interacting transcriptional regulator [Clostridium sp. MB40-C1]WMJ79231.1 sigma 54-interacting transcriptional regulator [Clostridium sp. MB40-C1]
MEILKQVFNTIGENVSEALIGIDKNEKIFVLNKQAEKLFNIKSEENLGKDINDTIIKNKLKEVLVAKQEKLNQRISKSGKMFNLNIFPLEIDGEMQGAFAICQDLEAYRNIQEHLYGNKIYVDILDILMNMTNEWSVIIDKSAKIIMMSKAYREFVGVDKPEGKDVRKVIENTRLHKVLETGESEVADIQEIKGNKMITMRVPIKQDGEVIGAIGKAMFKDVGDFFSLSKKLRNLEKEIEYYKKELGKEESAKYSFNDITGSSDKTRSVKEMAMRAANTDSNVLIVGESGTGKELYANAIHNGSKRRLAPFIKINCGAIPNELLESELFGYEEGAFTGAKKGGKKGKFELANGGTILLDEIGDMPLNMQVKLLRVIQERELMKVGGSELKNIDVRIIAATNKNLEEKVEKGEFREDLYYRLNVMKLVIPPLRERKEDIPALADSLRIKVANRLGIYVEGISKQAMEHLINYHWPGNIRQLENIIERAINLLDSNLIIEQEHLPDGIIENKVKYSVDKSKYLSDIIEEIERKVIAECLTKTKGNKNETSKILGISRAGLYKKIEKYNLNNV